MQQVAKWSQLQDNNNGFYEAQKCALSRRKSGAHHKRHRTHTHRTQIDYSFAPLTRLCAPAALGQGELSRHLSNSMETFYQFGRLLALCLVVRLWPQSRLFVYGPHRDACDIYAPRARNQPTWGQYITLAATEATGASNASLSIYSVTGLPFLWRVKL